MLVKLKELELSLPHYEPLEAIVAIVFIVVIVRVFSKM